MNSNKTALADALRTEEFIQIHEHIRQRDGSMSNILTLVVTATTTMLAAVAALVFPLTTNTPNKVSVWYCYLFLTPLPLLIFGFSILSSHRDDIYRMGFYLHIFVEETYGGASWHVRLAALRKRIRGESHDPSLGIIWSLFALSSFLFLFSIHFASLSMGLYALILILPFAALAYQHRRFTASRSHFGSEWAAVKRAEERDSETK
jgi:hypothetical protein